MKEKKEKKVSKDQLVEMIRKFAQEAIKEHKATKKENVVVKENKVAAKPITSKKITVKELREMVKESILDIMEEELDKRLVEAKKPKKK